MQNTTVEIIERIGNATHQLAGSLVEHGNNSTTTAFALRHTTSIDDDLAELGRRLSELEQTYASLSKLIGNLEDEAREFHLQTDDARATAALQEERERMRKAFGEIARLIIHSPMPDTNEIYHQCYMALVGDLDLPANEQAEIMRAAIDAAIGDHAPRQQQAAKGGEDAPR